MEDEDRVEDRNHYYRREYLQYQETGASLLAQAIFDNDITTVQTMLHHSSTYSEVNEEFYEGNTPLHIAIIGGSKETFHYLLNLKNVDINKRNHDDETPLFLSASMYSREYFGCELIRRGADMTLQSEEKIMPLQQAVMSNRLIMVKTMIEYGADINENKCRALRYAIKYNLTDMAYMLLYYVDYPSVEFINIKALLRMYPRIDDTLHEIVFNYIFDEFSTCCLDSLNTCLWYGSNLIVDNIIDLVSGITYNSLSELKEFSECFALMSLKHMEKIFQKFKYIMDDMFPSFFDLEKYVSYVDKDIVNKLYWLCESPYWSTIIRKNDLSTPLLYHIIYKSQRFDISLEDLTKLCIHLCSYGAPVSFPDINEAYIHYGNCELYEFLRHNKEDTSVLCRRMCFLPSLQCGVNVELDTLLKHFTRFFSIQQLPQSLKDLMKFFSGRKVKEFCLKHGGDHKDIIEKAEKMSEVPRLEELSRDAYRKFLIERYEVKNFKQFYSILEQLLLPGILRNILMFYKPLYVY